MSYVAEAAREALRAAGANFRQARRTLFLAAGVLALLHLLTVGPYIGTAKRLAGIEAAMQANQALLAAVDPNVASLADASSHAEKLLTAALDRATQQMIGQFQALQPLVAEARDGHVPPLAPMQSRQNVRQYMQQQMPQQAQQQMQQQMQQQAQQQMDPQPLPQQQAPTVAWTDIPQQVANMPALSQAPQAVDPALHAVLTAIAEQQQQAYPAMTAYGRDEIVIPAYRQAQRTWDQDIRPYYTGALTALIKSARAAAANAPHEAKATADSLRTAAGELEKRLSEIEAIALRHDQLVDDSLSSDWWFTVEGKAAYAGAVTTSIKEQLDSILGVASGASKEIQQTLALQARLRGEIKTAQESLKEQFNAQRAQLTSLSGFGGVLPVDLVSFIGLFPLVLGLVLGLLLLRAAEERRQAAQAAADLTAAADADPEARQWLIRQVLGANGWLLTTFLTLAIAIAAAAWVWFAGRQVLGVEPPPVLSSDLSTLLGAGVIAVAALWDLAAVFRLVRAGSNA